jgi:hypothetical protein
MMEKKDGRIGWHGMRHVTQIGDGLAAKGSAKMPQKHEQGPDLTELMAQRSRLQVHTLRLAVQYPRFNLAHSGFLLGT